MDKFEKIGNAIVLISIIANICISMILLIRDDVVDANNSLLWVIILLIIYNKKES